MTSNYLQNNSPTSLGGPCKMPTARALLRSATAEVHARLHLHPGFAALAAGEIGLVDYRLLLERLYGFHIGFEAINGIASVRSVRIADDLGTLGASVSTVTRLPVCNDIPLPRTAAAALGGRYVVEGAGLGGQLLARALDGLLAGRSENTRSFLQGDGSATGLAWRGFLVELEAGVVSLAERGEATGGAVAVFGAFETWLAGWRS